MLLRWFTPPRRRGIELLDLPETTDAVREAAMRDVERSNALFGGTRSVVRAVRRLAATVPRGAIVLDVATGTGDIAAVVRRIAPDWTVVGLDRSTILATRARGRLDGAVAGDALALPVADRSVDVVTCSQALHHFFGDDARRLVAELHRVSRGHVVVSDIRRSRLAAAGFWLASIALGFHPVTRRDGVTSVFRGFTADELRALVREVTGVTPVVRRGIFWRLAATWPKQADRLS
ncbi:MAG TPA: methyltransferase domain-containing protein [Gemmatimonadaceae bacterium]|nr:methyltransferase domain-containing protein [Gemmatimonadaceae bacterium]